MEKSTLRTEYLSIRSPDYCINGPGFGDAEATRASVILSIWKPRAMSWQRNWYRGHSSLPIEYRPV